MPILQLEGPRPRKLEGLILLETDGKRGKDL